MVSTGSTCVMKIREPYSLRACANAISADVACTIPNALCVIDIGLSVTTYMELTPGAGTSAGILA